MFSLNFTFISVELEIPLFSPCNLSAHRFRSCSTLLENLLAFVTHVGIFFVLGRNSTNFIVSIHVKLCIFTVLTEIHSMGNVDLMNPAENNNSVGKKCDKYKTGKTFTLLVRVVFTNFGK